jgi:hypothetical protein
MVGQYYSIGAENFRVNRLAAKLPGGCAAFYVAAPQSSRAEWKFAELDAEHDAMLVSINRHVPTLNGRSGKYPAGWSLRNVRATHYEDYTARGIAGKVCRLELE